jgi:hypothetical protein
MNSLESDEMMLKPDGKTGDDIAVGIRVKAVGGKSVERRKHHGSLVVSPAPKSIGAHGLEILEACWIIVFRLNTQIFCPTKI